MTLLPDTLPLDEAPTRLLAPIAMLESRIGVSGSAVAAALLRASEIVADYCDAPLVRSTWRQPLTNLRSCSGFGKSWRPRWRPLGRVVATRSMDLEVIEQPWQVLGQRRSEVVFADPVCHGFVDYTVGFAVPETQVSWSPGTTILRGSWIGTDRMRKFFAETSGVTSVQEPSWLMEIGETVQDGDVLWVAEDCFSLSEGQQQSVCLLAEQIFRGTWDDVDRRPGVIAESAPAGYVGYAQPAKGGVTAAQILPNPVVVEWSSWSSP